MKLSEYAEALLKLPPDFLDEDHPLVPLTYFHDRLIAAHINLILVYEKGSWINISDPEAFKDEPS